MYKKLCIVSCYTSFLVFSSLQSNDCIITIQPNSSQVKNYLAGIFDSNGEVSIEKHIEIAQFFTENDCIMDDFADVASFLEKLHKKYSFSTIPDIIPPIRRSDKIALLLLGGIHKRLQFDNGKSSNSKKMINVLEQLLDRYDNETRKHIECYNTALGSLECCAAGCFIRSLLGLPCQPLASCMGVFALSVYAEGRDDICRQLTGALFDHYQHSLLEKLIKAGVFKNSIYRDIETFRRESCSKKNA